MFTDTFPAQVPAANVRIGDIVIRQTNHGELRGEVIATSRRTIPGGDVIDIVTRSASGLQRRYTELPTDGIVIARRPH